MGKKSLNYVLGRNLDAEMTKRKLSNNALGKAAKIAPNTIANYRKAPEHKPTTGKERSAKLTEIERIADALNLSAVALLTDQEALQEQLYAITSAAASAIGAHTPIAGLRSSDQEVKESRQETRSQKNASNDH